jgi:hypothetical protein
MVLMEGGDGVGHDALSRLVSGLVTHIKMYVHRYRYIIAHCRLTSYHYQACDFAALSSMCRIGPQFGDGARCNASMSS